jgi:predicted NUDIX family phosphoesterase
MNKRKCSLENDVRAALERACHEQDLQVAEHLLQALETLVRRNGDDDELKRIYLKIASSFHNTL